MPLGPFSSLMGEVAISWELGHVYFVHNGSRDLDERISRCEEKYRNILFVQMKNKV